MTSIDSGKLSSDILSEITTHMKYAKYVPEKKRRVDGVFLVESEVDPSNETAATPRPSNWATMTRSQKDHWRRKTKRRNK